MIQTAVLGYGTVGSGVVEVIEKNKEEINKAEGPGRRFMSSIFLI